MAQIKNDPRTYRSRASIASGVQSDLPKAPAKIQENLDHLRVAKIDSRWYVQFSMKTS